MMWGLFSGMVTLVMLVPAVCIVVEVEVVVGDIATLVVGLGPVVGNAMSVVLHTANGIPGLYGTHSEPVTVLYAGKSDME